MEEREAEAVTKEQTYREQMKALGIYQEIFEPEIKTLARIEREYTRAEKAWSATAAPGAKPSFLDPHWGVIQRLRAEILQHREALGLTPKALRKLTGGAGTDAPEQKDLITSKLDAIAARVAGYDVPGDNFPGDPDAMGADPQRDPFSGIPAAEDAAAVSDRMDRQDHPDDYDLAAAVAEDMG